ncbi:MAG: hypothetical protein JNK94_02775 [Hyphomonadaceae bacterium]|nr:hypothetical protein [Hyphomonadaceae bacterium]MBX3509982.1 hypothetical protein [Hyphomonadaceae bacterium]
MRRIFLVFLLSFGLAPIASADPPNAHTAFVERQALLEIDGRCHLLEAGPRTALQAGAAQARGALLRAGWTLTRMNDLESAVRAAARERSCDDARTRAAAAEARGAYADWATASVMDFPGLRRSWTARRTVGANGWRLSQTIDAPLAAVFGVREFSGPQQLALIVPGEHAGGVQISLRDSARASAASLDLTARMAYGLEAGAPALGAPARSFPATRRVERLMGRVQTVYIFPNEAFSALLQLDPRESVVLRMAGPAPRTLYVEVGDVAAARAFLTLRAD